MRAPAACRRRAARRAGAASRPAPAARCADRVERPSASSGSRRAPPARRPGLHDDHADRVGDDVVQLPGDPQPLLGDGRLGRPLAIPVETLDVAGQRRLSRAALTDGEAGEIGRADEDLEEQHRVEGQPVRIPNREDGGRGDERQHGGDAAQPAHVGARRVHGAHQGEGREVDVVVARHVLHREEHRERQHHERETGEWGAAPDRDPQRGDHPRRGRRARRRRAVSQRPDLDLRHDQHRRGEQQVQRGDPERAHRRDRTPARATAHPPRGGATPSRSSARATPRTAGRATTPARAARGCCHVRHHPPRPRGAHRSAARRIGAGRVVRRRPGRPHARASPAPRPREASSRRSTAGPREPRSATGSPRRSRCAPPAGWPAGRTSPA